MTDRGLIAELPASSSIKGECGEPLTRQEEIQLTASAQAGDVDAQEKLIDLYGPLVKRAILATARNSAAVGHLELKSLIRDVFTRVFTAKKPFRGDSALSTYLHRCAFNAYTNFAIEHNTRSANDRRLFESLSGANSRNGGRVFVDHKLVTLHRYEIRYRSGFGGYPFVDAEDWKRGKKNFRFTVDDRTVLSVPAASIAGLNKSLTLTECWLDNLPDSIDKKTREVFSDIGASDVPEWLWDSSEDLQGTDFDPNWSATPTQAVSTFNGIISSGYTQLTGVHSTGAEGTVVSSGPKILAASPSLPRCAYRAYGPLAVLMRGGRQADDRRRVHEALSVAPHLMQEALRLFEDDGLPLREIYDRFKNLPEAPSTFKGFCVALDRSRDKIRQSHTGNAPAPSLGYDAARPMRDFRFVPV